MLADLVIPARDDLFPLHYTYTHPHKSARTGLLSLNEPTNQLAESALRDVNCAGEAGELVIVCSKDYALWVSAILAQSCCSVGRCIWSEDAHWIGARTRHVYEEQPEGIRYWSRLVSSSSSSSCPGQQ